MIFASDLGQPEGPVCLDDGRWLVVEMRPDRGWVARLSPDGKTKQVLAQTGRPNGLAVDRDGAVWVAESKTPSLLRLTLGGNLETMLTGCAGEPFLFPNDLAFGPDGSLYMTDSGIRHDDFAPGGSIRSDYLTAPMDGRVYRIDPRTLAIAKLDSGYRFTNGLAFGPEGSLYVNETVSGLVYRYGRRADGGLGGREVFGDVVDRSLPPAWRGPDGMKFGSNGELFATVYGQGDVTVLGAGGAVVRRIKTAGKRPTNVAFGPAGENRIYVTEVELGALEVHEARTDGLPLFR